MYVLARSAPRAPLCKVFWTGEFTEIELDDGAWVKRPEVGFFPADGWWFDSMDDLLAVKRTYRRALSGFVPTSVRPQAPPRVPLH